MRRLFYLALIAGMIPLTAGGQVSPQLYSGLHWRFVGTWRGGKATTVVGLAGQPSTYYMGTDGSGVWKTADGGRSWHNISDAERLTGIGAVAAVAAAPQLLYVAADRGNTGLYRSTDGGGTLALVALAHTAVADVWVDPKNPQVALAASSAGISRSGDGGNTWAVVLTAQAAGGGAVDIEAAPEAGGALYAAIRPPFGRFRPGQAPTAKAPSIFRSSDGGRTWAAVAGTGLPESGQGRVGLAVAPGTQGQRVYAYMAQGVFRSDDGGAHWRQTTTDPRLVGGGQFFHIYVDPGDANVLYAMQTAVYRSSDGGATWQSFTGAPSGDDCNALWISPTHPLDMALSLDQGTEISMDGGHTWTSWYNQPTGEMYNVTTDGQFPFHLYASQQDSGTVAVPIRANDGEITYRDWWTTNGFESARITPDPLHPNIVYVTGWFGSVLRTDHTTGQSVHVFERNPEYREAGSMPMEFLPGDPHTLLLGTQYLLATSDGGRRWKRLSPDLTMQPNGGAPAPAARAGRSGRNGAAISAIAPSPKNFNEIWVGTSNGLVQRTTDGGHTWRVVTPPGVRSSIAMIEPGHQDADVAYAVAGGGRRRGAPAGTQPEVYRTSDAGRTWTALGGGLPTGVHAVREDPVDPQLLFAAADSGVFVSFDTGAHWQSLELNLPAASCRDLQIRRNHLVLATYGRGLWSLDDIGPLQQMTAAMASEPVHLFQPTTAIRLQWDDYTDTPLNPETPHSDNPPDGAVLDYYLQGPVAGPLKLTIYDSRGREVNQYSSQGPTRPPYQINVPDYWLAPPQLLPNQAGLNQFVWNLRYPDPPHVLFTYFGLQRDYFEYTLADHAIEHNTPWHEPQGAMVVPGMYKVVLTVDGHDYSAPLTVKLDPRLKEVTQQDLTLQLAVAQSLSDGLAASTKAYQEATAALQAGAEQSKQAQALQKTLGSINMQQARLLSGVTQADAAPGEEVQATVSGLCRQFEQAATQWNQIGGLPEIHAPHCGGF